MTIQLGGILTFLLIYVAYGAYNQHYRHYISMSTVFRPTNLDPFSGG